MLALRVHKKHQSIVFLTQILKQNLLRLAIRLLHIIDQKLREIASHNPSRTLRIRQLGSIALRLLKRIQHRSVALHDTLAQVLVNRLLLNQHLRRGNMPVDEIRVIDLHLLLISDERAWILDTKHLRQQFRPKHLRVTLFVTPAFPSRCKLRSRRRHLFLSSHIYNSTLFHLQRYKIFRKRPPFFAK